MLSRAPVLPALRIVTGRRTEVNRREFRHLGKRRARGCSPVLCDQFRGERSRTQREWPEPRGDRCASVVA